MNENNLLTCTKISSTGKKFVQRKRLPTGTLPEYREIQEIYFNASGQFRPSAPYACKHIMNKYHLRLAPAKYILDMLRTEPESLKRPMTRNLLEVMKRNNWIQFEHLIREPHTS